MALDRPIEEVMRRERLERRVGAGALAAFVQAALSLIVGLLVALSEVGIRANPWEAIVGAAITGGLGFGVLRGSRMAAAGLLLMVAIATVSKIIVFGFPSGIVSGLIFGYFYVRGFVALLEAHRLERAARMGTRVNEGGATAVGHGG